MNSARDIVIRLRVDLQQQIPKIDSSAAQQSTEAITRAMEQAHAQNVRAAEAAMQSILQQTTTGSAQVVNEAVKAAQSAFQGLLQQAAAQGAQISSEVIKGAQTAVDQILKNVATQGEAIAKAVADTAAKAAQDAAKQVEISVKTAAAVAAVAAKSVEREKPDEEHLNVELQLQYEELADAIMAADTARSAGLRTIREETKLLKEDAAANAGVVRGTIDLVRATILLTGARSDSIQMIVKGIAAIEGFSAVGRAATTITASLAAARAMNAAATSGATAAEIAHAGALARSAAAAQAAAAASGLLNIALGPVGWTIIAVTAAVYAYVQIMNEKEEAERLAAEYEIEKINRLNETAKLYRIVAEEAAAAARAQAQIESEVRDRSLSAVEQFGTPEQLRAATAKELAFAQARANTAADQAAEAERKLREIQENSGFDPNAKQGPIAAGVSRFLFEQMRGDAAAIEAKSLAEESLRLKEEEYELSLRKAKQDEASVRSMVAQVQLATELLRKEQERIESQEERIGRLDRGQRSQLERIEAKRAAGQELSTADLKFIEDTLGRTEFTGEQFRQRGKGGADQFSGLFGGGLTPEERKKVEDAEAAAGLDSEGTTEERIAALREANKKLEEDLKNAAGANLNATQRLVELLGTIKADFERVKERVDNLTTAPHS